MFISEIEAFLNEKADEKARTPVVITGDFNSIPSSAVYQLYSQGHVSGSHPEMLDWPSDAAFSQNFQLKSAYAEVNEPATNYTPWFKE